MSNFRPVDRDTGFLMPPSVDEWLPERHLARFVVEVIVGLDLRAMTGDYRGSGEASYHPSVLLGLLVYGYATGVFSSRKLERATYDSVAFRFIAANQHPDHDTIASFRRRFLKPNFHTCYATLSGTPQNTAPFASLGKVVVLNLEVFDV
jgi:transposase